jgi:5-methylthioadenosine/S-adenosylhomocysteine deaminase
MYDPLSHLVYVTRGDDVTTTIVNGRVLMRDRKVLTLTEADVIKDANAFAAKVREAVGK